MSTVSPYTLAPQKWGPSVRTKILAAAVIALAVLFVCFPFIVFSVQYDLNELDVFALASSFAFVNSLIAFFPIRRCVRALMFAVYAGPNGITVQEPDGLLFSSRYTGISWDDLAKVEMQPHLVSLRSGRWSDPYSVWRNTLFIESASTPGKSDIDVRGIRSMVRPEQQHRYVQTVVAEIQAAQTFYLGNGAADSPTASHAKVGGNNPRPNESWRQNRLRQTAAAKSAAQQGVQADGEGTPAANVISVASPAKEPRLPLEMLPIIY